MNQEQKKMKKYIITGSIGHISKPIVEGLVKAGNEVKVITSSAEKVQSIEALGAKALVGRAQDVGFLTSAFTGADAVYTMIPPIWQTTNWRADMNIVGKNYLEALKAANIKYVVNLSSVGAHMGTGAGPVDGLHDFENMLNSINGLNVMHLRPASFFYNLFNQIGLIKNMNIAGSNYGAGDNKIAMVHTNDVAKAGLENLLNLTFIGSSIQYIASDERTGAEIAEVLGKAIGKTFPWVEFPDDQAKAGMLQAGLDEEHAENFMTMGVAMRNGKMQEDYLKNKPKLSGVKLEDFAKEFAAAYNA